jgi:DNA-binding transcriptional regulator YiaG
MQKRSKSGTIFLVKTTPENKALKDAFRVTFVKRTVKIREDSGLTRAEVAGLLGIKADLYRKYEESVAMPHHLIPRFLAITRGDARFLLGLSSRNKRPKLSAVS